MELKKSVGQIVEMLPYLNCSSQEAENDHILPNITKGLELAQGKQHELKFVKSPERKSHKTEPKTKIKFAIQTKKSSKSMLLQREKKLM